MKRSQTSAALLFVFVLLAPVTWAQLEEHMAFRQEMEELSRGGRLSNPLLFFHLSCADGAVSGSPPAECQPVIRMLIRNAAPDRYRLPSLPPNLAVPKVRLKVDKQRLKQEEKGDPAFFTQACQQLPVQDICDEGWRLTKVWTLAELPTDGLRMTLRTALVKPGATSHQIGSETSVQTLALEVSAEAVGEGVLIPLWEQRGYLNVPVTFTPPG